MVNRSITRQQGNENKSTKFMFQSIIGVLFGTNNHLKVQLDKGIYYAGDEVINNEVYYCYSKLIVD